ncbi:L-aspartate oxidase [Planococcus salinus]|uniref:L-aspartate oxidase n=1 Tax=Planococcus salinus TaxID=1848460 RepID=A0A3M8PC15_9BACL|nr:L-aspartate oxidase [Planococcus salinus]RNF41247.1 L-aspartate oxidase [Planococcus salinus]
MFDVCIIGGGVAGLMLAHSLPDHYKVAILTKHDAMTNNTAFAQGGIAASLGAGDSPSAHAEDTMVATAQHADAERVELMVREGLETVELLLAQGLPYDADDRGFPELGQEGAHRFRRILHAGGDQTGKMLMRFLLEQVKDKAVQLPFHQALELIVEDGRCQGVLVGDAEGRRSTVHAAHIVLATGGIGQLYSQTSNSAIATGDGLSLAYHAGAVLEDLEFVQFHPTVLHLNGRSCGLVSEAVRGEGALLVNRHGKRIMEHVHPLLELAPRDIVARTIEWQYQQFGTVYLDARPIDDFPKKFPSIYLNCRKYGFDPTYELLPVRPGAHFHMGGIQTGDSGETSVPGLYALGETASTGVHGANRLASNSLLEGLAFAKRLADRLQQLPAFVRKRPFGKNSRTREFVLPENLPLNMTEKVGILRDKKELEKFLDAHPLRQFSLRDYSNSDIQDIHRYTASSLIATAAFLRDESRGGHYRMDAPETSAKWTGKVLQLSKHGVKIADRKIEQKETVG